MAAYHTRSVTLTEDVQIVKVSLRSLMFWLAMNRQAIPLYAIDVINIHLNHSLCTGCFIGYLENAQTEDVQEFHYWYKTRCIVCRQYIVLCKTEL